MVDDNRITPGLMQALKIPPEQQVGFILAKLQEISRDQSLAQAADVRMESKLDEINKQLADGKTTFALQAQKIDGLDNRLTVMETAAKESQKPSWWVTSVLAPVAVVVLTAVVWFLLQGAIATAHGPTTTVNRQETITTPAARP